MAKLLEIKNLVTNFYTYEGVVKALNRISLDVEHGEIFGLVGESGCGKSVTVRSLMRIIQEPGRIDGGEVILHYDGQAGATAQSVDLLQQSEHFMESLRGDQISMIFQEPNAALNPIMSIGDQVAESFLFHREAEMCRKIYKDLAAGRVRGVGPLAGILKGLYELKAKSPHHLLFKLLGRLPILKKWDRLLHEEARRRSGEIIARLGIANADEIIKRYPHNLSGGMKQRIVIAIALACSPMLLIADEATSNLDVTIQAQILALLRDLRRRKAISSILLITHDLGVVAETCDRVGVMYAGNLCEVGSIGDIFENPKHPYTAALLNSVPRVAQEGALQSIEGSVPNLVSPPTGCRFHPRCPHVKEICRQRFPETVAVDNGHTVACYRYTDNPRPRA
ncbi:MAG: ABC transporter ATP-binding protein [Desulfosarcinaceae bacterium]|nr:ABC transporter ATP-binding protein [Desulfosarcinaceae bacterium]